MTLTKEKIMELAQLIRELKHWQGLTGYSRYNKKNKREEYHKRCYEIGELLNWDTELIKKIEPQLGISVHTLNKHANKYALEVLKIPKDELSARKYEHLYTKNKVTKNHIYYFDKYNNLLEQLITLTDKEEIINIISHYLTNTNIKITILKSKIALYVIENYPDQKNSLMVSLNQKIDLYIQYQAEQKSKDNSNISNKYQQQKEKLMKEATLYVTKFIESSCKTIEEFCLKENIELEDFGMILYYCKHTDLDLYKEYYNELVMRNNPLGANLEELIKQIVYLLENGIEEKDGAKRFFHPIDIYLMMSLNFKDISWILREDSDIIRNILTLEEIRIIKQFFNKNKDNFKSNLISEPEVLTKNFTKAIPVSINEEEIIYCPCKEETLIIMNFLNQNNIPINEYNYIEAMTRYLNNQLPLDYIPPKQRRLINV